MKKYLMAVLLCTCFAICPGVVRTEWAQCLMAQTNSAAYEAYISKYGSLAVEEMYRSGVPASITLAQGLLESNAGLSKGAVEGNNHFGIKANGWKGRVIYLDDDRKHEAFRAYGSVKESYLDHSDFLRYNDRYKSLFDNEITDYRAWAYGLKRAGYATDPAYPSKLISLIERYDLSRFDKMKLEDIVPYSVGAGSGTRQDRKDGKKVQADNAAASSVNAASPSKSSGSRKSRKNRQTKAASKSAAGAVAVIPPSPHQLEKPQKFTSPKSGTFKFSLKREMYSLNGVPFVYAVEGESYKSIAEDYNLFFKEILKYNDLNAAPTLVPGTVVYLQPKKKGSVKGMDKYIADEAGVTLQEISQRYAVKLKSLCKMNLLPENYVLKEGDVVRLRK